MTRVKKEDVFWSEPIMLTELFQVLTAQSHIELEYFHSIAETHENGVFAIANDHWRDHSGHLRRGRRRASCCARRSCRACRGRYQYRLGRFLLLCGHHLFWCLISTASRIMTTASCCRVNNRARVRLFDRLFC